MKPLRYLTLFLICFFASTENVMAQCDNGLCCDCVIERIGEGSTPEDALTICDTHPNTQCSDCTISEAYACLPISDYKYLIVGGALVIGGLYTRKLF